MHYANYLGSLNAILLQVEINNGKFGAGEIGRSLEGR
jgi:hypothetical protein